jgi:hypothetical protein
VPWSATYLVPALFVVAVTLATILGYRRWPAGLIAWTSYIVLLAPVVGILHNGAQITADRYTYLACAPWAILGGAGIAWSRHAARSGKLSSSVGTAVMGAAERAWQRWLEGVCLDTENGAFEAESSPFAERPVEVLRAVMRPGIRSVSRARDLTPFLRRPGNRDCQRILGRLEHWFLRQYDVHHAAVMRHHAEALRTGAVEPDRVLSRHGTRAYVLALLLPSLPFVAAIFAYDSAPQLFDSLAALEVAGLLALVFWFLVFRFLIQKDVTFFHTSVPRIGAGIIVGYLPVFLTDEVWDLARQPLPYLLAVVLMLGFAILLYLYVEVHSRLGDTRRAFRRALDIFMLGMIESAGLGLIVTSLLGPLMAGRNWGLEHANSLAEARGTLTPFLGELPRVMGFDPFWVFPSTVLLTSVLAFFIGTFLQLLWEDLPITEPL